MLAVFWALLAMAVVACAQGTQPAPSHATGDTAPPQFGPGGVVTVQGQESASLYPIVFAIAVIIFILVEGLIIFMAIRFRRRHDQDDLPTQTHGNSLLEIAWTVVPAIIVTALFVLSMSVLVKVDADTDQPAVVVDVTGFQWQWTFAYPDYPTSGGPLSFTGAGRDGPEMVLPVDQTIRIRLHAQDVIHSFYVPSFFFKRDAIPGRINEFEVNVKEPGTYGGQCAEFCGLSHADMYFTVRAVSRAEFDTWAADAVAKANATPPPPPSGGPSGGPPGGSVNVDSVSVTAGFDPKTLTAPAGQPLTVQLKNSDTSAPHNFAVKAANPDGSDWVGVPPAQPGQSATYQSPPLKPGTYTFFCAIHPNMTGTLTVGP